MRMALDLTREMGGPGGEVLPPLEAPQGAGQPLTAAAATLVKRIDGVPL